MCTGNARTAIGDRRHRDTTTGDRQHRDARDARDARDTATPRHATPRRHDTATPRHRDWRPLYIMVCLVLRFIFRHFEPTGSCPVYIMLFYFEFLSRNVDSKVAGAYSAKIIECMVYF